MKSTQRDFVQKAGAAKGKFRVHFLCGPDEAGASAAAGKVIAALPDPGERVELSGQDLKGDPVRLVDEARSTSLFGDSRHLYVRVSGEEGHDALATFCQLADGGEADQAWPVFVIATACTDKSRTAKLLIDRADALVAMFYLPDQAFVTAEVRAMADASGLRLNGDLAERIARAAGLDVRLAQSEVEKLALYLDATPQTPKAADAAAWDAVGAKTEDDGFAPLVNAVLSGDLRKVPGEIARMREIPLNPVGVALALERRAAQLAGLAAKLRPGGNIGGLLESQRIFFKERPEIEKQLRQWPGTKLERLVPRLTNLHRALLAGSQTAELLLAQELTQIARFAAARR
jgi:DNA polymerase-3 subunit delta